MTTIPPHVEAYWAAFLESQNGSPGPRARFYESFRIGSDEQDANEGAALILNGTKTATSSLLWEYEHDGRPLPTVGCHSVLEDGSGQPVCVVETTQVAIVPFLQVDARFARDYGEGDGTLEGWRETFRDYYAGVCVEIGREMSDDAPLVCERFQVVYR